MAKTWTPATLFRTKRARGLAALVLVPMLGIVGAWWSIHHVPGFGPWLADSLRAVVGVEAVSRLEESGYGIEDRWNRLVRRGQAPKRHWQVPAESELRASASRAPVDGAPIPVEPKFRP